MNPHIFIRLLLLSAVSMILAACQEMPASDSTNAATPSSHYAQNYTNPNHSDIDTSLVSLTKHVPTRLSEGQTFESTIDVKALRPLASAVITDTIPKGTTLINSQPAAKQNGQQLRWTLGAMDRGDMTTLRLWLKANQQGSPVTCTTISAIPRTCHRLMIGKPQLVIEKVGPTRVELGRKFDYEISVKNTGNTAANNVRLIDQMPSEVRSSDSGTLNYNLGTLQAGQASKLLIVHAMGNQRGDFCNIAKVTADNHQPVDSQACTTIYQPMVTIRKQGSRTALLGKRARYTLTVHNSGDTNLSNVVVTDTIPNGTRIVASPGATVNGRTAKWVIDQLTSNARQNFSVTLSSAVAGRLCNEAQVTTTNISDDDYACTNWKGVPSLLVELVDTRDSLLVGDQTSYQIRITNQGSAEDKNLKIKAVFPSTIQPVSTQGGQIDTNTASFSVPTLAAKQSITYMIQAKAVKIGTRKIIVTVNSPSQPSAVVEEESTSVY